MMKRVSITLSRLLPFLVLMLIAARSFAALPGALSYQGYLTDAGGTPLDTTVSITFSLYNVATAGTAAWTETQSVPVANGLFTVQLGSQGNPLPPALFDNPVWLGMEVGTDGEMSPRKALTTVGFAFRAQQAEIDADTLASLQCTAGQVTKYDGTSWICAADEGSNTGQFNALGTIKIPMTTLLDFDVTGVEFDIANNPSSPTPFLGFSVTINTTNAADISELYGLYANQQVIGTDTIIDLPQHDLQFKLRDLIINRIDYTTDDSLIYPDRTQVTLDLSQFALLEVNSFGPNHLSIIIDMPHNAYDACAAYENYSNIQHISGLPGGTGKFKQLSMYAIQGGGDITLDGLNLGDDAPCFIGAVARRTQQDLNNPITVRVYDPANNKDPLSTLEMNNSVYIDQYNFRLSLDGLEQSLRFSYGGLQVD